MGRPATASTDHRAATDTLGSRSAHTVSKMSLFNQLSARQLTFSCTQLDNEGQPPQNS